MTTTPEQEQVIKQRIETMAKWTVPTGSPPRQPLTPQQLIQQTFDHWFQVDMGTMKRTSDRAAACAKVTDAAAKKTLGCP